MYTHSTVSWKGNYTVGLTDSLFGGRICLLGSFAPPLTVNLGSSFPTLPCLDRWNT
jgi:hypothetical protein